MARAELPEGFLSQFRIEICDKCGLEHAPIRTCEEAREFHDVNKEKK